jgi:hypothetical protein
LPLYARAVQTELNLPAPPAVGYALLPDAVTSTGVVEFEELPELLDGAMEWAEESARRIVTGVFWPPASKPQFDGFGALAPDGLGQALGEGWAELLSPPVEQGAAAP